MTAEDAEYWWLLGWVGNMACTSPALPAEEARRRVDRLFALAKTRDDREAQP